MQKLWEDVDIKVDTYVHSSIGEEGPVVHHSVSSSPNSNIINLSLIWKDGEVNSYLKKRLSNEEYVLIKNFNFSRRSGTCIWLT